MIRIRILSILLVQFITFLSYPFLCAQEANKQNTLSISINEEKDHWVKFSAYLQTWLRVNQNNPGTVVFDQPENVTTDVSIRRFRMALQAKPYDRLYVFMQLGMNNLNYLSSRGTPMNLLDAYTEYTFSKALTVGMGKSAWDGLSRYTSPSSSKQMSYDIPFVALPTLGNTDDLIRKLSVFMKGKLGKLDYRLVFIKPLSVRNSSTFDPMPKEGEASFTDRDSNFQFASYFKYEIFDQESNRTPFHAGSYHGAKKVLNIGVGFNSQKKALWSLDQGDTVFHSMNLIAVDLFLDMPINKLKNTAITYYSAFYFYDFGPNYIRSIGANNPANGVDPNNASFNGKGNAFPMIGTGETWLHQFGYLLPLMGKEKKSSQFQPYLTFQISDFEKLDDIMMYFDLGVNWLFDSHRSKFTLNYQNRPIFFDTDQGIKVEQRNSMFVLQYQVRID